MAIEAIRGNAGSASYGATEARATTATTETPKVVEATSAAPAVDFATNATRNDAEGDLKGGNKPSEATVKQAISDINKKINPNTIAQYGYHDETNRVTIKIVNKDTDDVIKEFPAEETLDMIAKVWELAGMFVDEKG